MAEPIVGNVVSAQLTRKEDPKPQVLTRERAWITTCRIDHTVEPECGAEVDSAQFAEEKLASRSHQR